MSDKAAGPEGVENQQGSSDLSDGGRLPRSLIENLPLALYRCRADQEMMPVFMSSGIEAICGRPAKDFIEPGTATRLSIVHPEDRESLLRFWREAVDARSPFRHVYRIECPDGAVRWIEDRAAVIVEGAATFLDGIMLDVTEGKLHEAALVGAKVKADEASQAKSAFLATMSHEIRTPLNGMIGMAALLAKTETNPQQQKFIELLASSAEALLTLVNDILDFSKIEAGHLELQDSDYDPAALVCRVVEMLAPRAHAKNIEIGAFIDPREPRCLHGDPGRVRQILLNLVGNAIKFTEQGGISVELRTRRPRKGQALLVLRVRDTGIGIAPENVPRLFQRFAQLDSGANRRFGGSGLGLAICKELVELMGGEMAVESTLGNGSVFEARLPLAEGAGKAGSAQAKLGAGRIAVIADGNPMSRELLEHNLSAIGFQTHAFDTASALQDRWTRGSSVMAADLVVISDNLEDRVAEDLARVLHDDGLSAAKFVLCSTAPSNLSGGATEGDDFDLCLTKPVTPASVEACFDALWPSSVPAPAAALQSSVETPRHHLGDKPLRVLIVEDNEINQLLTINMLEGEGIPSKVAVNGEEALRMLAAERFDLVLMDIQMPVMDGFEATRAIRQLPSPLCDLPTSP
jgi:PAS domain S-box-containing protein